MHKKKGKHLVSYYPGEVIGCFAEGEVELREIAESLGGFSGRLFDNYLEFSAMADAGLLVRHESITNRGYLQVSFYYVYGSQVSATRQRIKNTLLHKYLNSINYPNSGLIVVSDDNGDLQFANLRVSKTIN